MVIEDGFTEGCSSISDVSESPQSIKTKYTAGQDAYKMYEENNVINIFE